MTREEALAALGLSDGATVEDIRVAYRELAQMLHPDKYGSNARLRRRAEQQMGVLNEARDALLKGPRAKRGSSNAQADAPRTEGNRVQRAAAARAQAAETARLTVVAQIRTIKEMRSRSILMAVTGVAGMLVATRLRGTLRLAGFPIASTLAVWGIVDIINARAQLSVLTRRARELQSDRDAARAVARGEV